MTALPSGASVEQVAARIRARTVSSLEVTQTCLACIRALDPVYHAYRTIMEESALAAAHDADAAVRGGSDAGPLLGVPISVKDTFLLRGTPTTVGSPIWATTLPGR